jgi:hypothetical protein
MLQFKGQLEMQLQIIFIDKVISTKELIVNIEFNVGFCNVF